MKKFMDQDFLLETATAVLLYDKYAKKMPIFDYHCCLHPQEIYEDRKFNDITEAWLVDGQDGDYYKWWAMRAHGVEEEFITGGAAAQEKFMQWAETVPYLMGNPLFQWTHMELNTFFGTKEILNPKTALKIYRQANHDLKRLTARKMLEKSDVKILCTIDEITDDLKWHLLLKEEKKFKMTVLPTFAPNKAVDIELPLFSDWVKKLGLITKVEINNLPNFLKALISRVDFFNSTGCKAAVHDLDEWAYLPAEETEIENIFQKGLDNEELTPEEIAKYKGYLLVFLGREYAKRDWVQQYHLGGSRSQAKQRFVEVKSNAGFAAIDDKMIAQTLSQLMGKLNLTNELPRTILYGINSDNKELFATITQCFQGEIKGKIQFGLNAGFNWQKEGIIKQMKNYSKMGLISDSIGILLDSQSFMAYPRHDYFRRIFCNRIGKLIEDGEYPNDLKLVGQIVQDICYNNALRYFGIADKK